MPNTSNISDSMLSATENSALASAARPAGSGRGTKLAVYGGPRAAGRVPFDRWRKIAWRDVGRLLFQMVCDHNSHFGGGGVIGQFEDAFTRLTETRYGILMNSGTSCLHSAYMAVGVKPGDEVIVPSYTFAASATPILHCGARPVFCDIDRDTLLADPEDVERRITPKTRAICVVHVWGNPARLDRFVEISRRHGIPLIEDCSHAHGATYQGRPVGSWGDIGCYSLQGCKAVTGGEAGIAVTNSAELHDRMLVIGHFGRTASEQKGGAYDIGNLCFGLKYRPHLYAAHMAYGSLSRLPELNRLRRKHYQLISQELEGCEAIRPIATYPEAVRGGLLEFIFHFRGSSSELGGGWNTGAFVNAVQAEGVPIIVDRYYPLHQHPLFTKPIPSGLGGAFFALTGTDEPVARPCQLPVTEQVCGELVSISPLTKVSERYVRACGRALRKVAEAIPDIRDLRTGQS